LGQPSPAAGTLLTTFHLASLLFALAAINYQSGQKFGPPENYFSLVSRGGPLSSIQGTRTTDVKVGSPPRPPAFVYTFDPKRSDTKDAGDKKGGGDAPKGAGDKKAGGRRLSQSECGGGCLFYRAASPQLEAGGIVCLQGRSIKPKSRPTDATSS
jgi:hypothetical protein